MIPTLFLDRDPIFIGERKRFFAFLRYPRHDELAGLDIESAVEEESPVPSPIVSVLGNLTMKVHRLISSLIKINFCTNPHL